MPLSTRYAPVVFTAALALSKAYRAIVREQSFAQGSDAILSPPKNVHKEVEENQPTDLETIVSAF